jgi:hypothetical protein
MTDLPNLSDFSLSSHCRDNHRWIYVASTCCIRQGESVNPVQEPAEGCGLSVRSGSKAGSAGALENHGKPGIRGLLHG